MIMCLSSSFSGDPLFLGRSPSPVFTARIGPNFPATDLYPDRIRCLKSNSSQFFLPKGDEADFASDCSTVLRHRNIQAEAFSCISTPNGSLQKWLPPKMT